MTPERWQQVRQVFDAAVALGDGERAEYLQRSCGGDAELLGEVDFLLRSHGAADAFLERPLVRLPGEDEADRSTAERRRIGPYEVHGSLGCGGMGTVYRAVRADREYQSQVAIKVLPPELVSEDLVRRFRSERQILAHLEHPNIARLLDGGTSSGGRPYLVMELVEGEPLDVYCDRHRLSIRERLELFSKVCRAVHFAHRHLIVHRDLKPHNVLVAADGEPKLIDFGIAKLLDPESFPQTVVATAPGGTPMTLRYASPEQVRGEAITTASDVYSLGVILYQLLSGQRPHATAGRNHQELVQAICDRKPERPSAAVGSDGTAPGAPSRDARKLRRALRGDLDNIVLKALRKEPERRYASAEDLAEDLWRHLRHRPVLARPDTLLYRTRKFLRRNRWSSLAAAAGLIALIVFLATLVDQRQRILREKVRAEEVRRTMVELFEMSDPDRALGERVTAREVMERGARGLPERLRDQPQLLADLLETIGEVDRKLGLYQESLPLLEQALEVRLQVEAEARPEVAANLVGQGYVLMLAGRYPEAEARYREALEILEAIRDDGRLLVEARSGLASVLKHVGDYEAAERLQLQALAMARRLGGEIDPQTASTLTALADLAVVRSRYGAAKAFYRRALAIHRQLYGDLHPQIAGLENNLAMVHRAEGDYDGAEELFGSALQSQRQLYDGPHPSLAATMTNLASLMHDRGRYDAAEELAREALADRREIYGSAHPKIAATLNLLGLIRKQRGDLDDTEKLLREALAMWSETLGEEHPEVAVGLTNLALVLRERGDLDQAEELLSRALAISRTALGTRHLRVAAIQYHLARLARQRGRLAEAKDLYEQTLTLRRQLLGDDHPEVAQSLHNLAGVVLELGDPVAAEGLFREALRIFRDKLGEEHTHVALAMQALASVLVERGEGREAESLARRALGILAGLRSPSHLWCSMTQAVVGSSLALQGRYREAEELLLDSYEELRTARGDEESLTVRTVERLIALYELWDQPEKAAEYRARLPR